MSFLKLFSTVLFLNLLLTPTASANPTPVKALEANEVPFSNPYLATLWGIIRVGMTVDYIPHVKTVRLISDRFDNANLKDRGVPVRIALQHRGMIHQQKPVKRPLLIYMPGLGSTHNGHWSRYTISKFFRRGYHVAVFPSPMSKDFLPQRHKHAPGNFIEEAKTQLDLIRQARKAIGEDLVSEIHFLAESYGAFVGSIMVALDSLEPSENRVFDHGISRVAFVSPPLDFSRTLERIDREVIETREPFSFLCNDFAIDIRLALEAIMRKGEENISETTKICARGHVVHTGFKRATLEGSEEFEKAWGVRLTPSDAREYSFWRQSVLVSEVFKLFNPRSNDILGNPDFRNFSYWIGQARRNSEINISILASTDDFLNDSGFWQNLPYGEFITDRMSLHERGGHMGFITSASFNKELFKIIPKAAD
jgi:hypothetical protein